MTTLAALIERLEKAPCGSADLDDVICDYLRSLDPNGNCVWAPYTTSIDSALTLVPEGWTATIYCRSNSAVVERGNPFMAHGGHARDFRLALCIAALRARGARHD